MRWVFTTSLLVLMIGPTASADENTGRESVTVLQAASTGLLADLSGFFGETSTDRKLILLGAVSGFMIVILVRLCFEFLRPSRRAENDKSSEQLP